MPLPGETFAGYRSLLIPDDLPTLLGLQTQMRLAMVTYRDVASPYAEMKVISIKIPLTLKFFHLFHKADNEEGPYMDNAEDLFSIAELAQVHRNHEHAPPGPVYRALRSAYTIEAGASDLETLVKVEKEVQRLSIS